MTAAQFKEWTVPQAASEEDAASVDEGTKNTAKGANDQLRRYFSLRCDTRAGDSCGAGVSETKTDQTASVQGVEAKGDRRQSF